MSNSKALQRQKCIVNLLESNEAVSIKQLADRFNASMWTVRRDLSSFEKRGVLKRSYGHASPAQPGHDSTRMAKRDSFRLSVIVNLEAKRRSGLAAARLLHSGECIALAGGTTNLEVAKAPRGSGFSGEVVTKALDIALELAEESEIHVICTGGDVQPRYHTLVRPETEDELFGDLIGWKVIRALKADEALRDIAVISCSWSTEPEMRSLVVSLAGHLQKPDLRYGDFKRALRTVGVFDKERGDDGLLPIRSSSVDTPIGNPHIKGEEA